MVDFVITGTLVSLCGLVKPRLTEAQETKGFLCYPYEHIFGFQYKLMMQVQKDCVVHYTFSVCCVQAFLEKVWAKSGIGVFLLGISVDFLLLQKRERGWDEPLDNQMSIWYSYHNQQKQIVETKILWGKSGYQTGKKQLATYLKLEGTTEGYYAVFDHCQNPEPRLETETIEDVTVRGYVIPLMRERPSEEHRRDA